MKSFLQSIDSTKKGESVFQTDLIISEGSSGVEIAECRKWLSLEV